MVLVGAFSGGGLVGVACGSSSDESAGPPPLSTSSSPKDAGPRDAGGDPVLDAMPMDAGPGATTYKGQLDATNAVKFGGDPYCEYTMTLKDVAIEVAALESGDIIGAAVKDLVLEATVPPCPHAPMDPAVQRFALTTVTPTASGATLAFEGAKTNQPETSLVIDLAKVGATYQASAEWKRVDLDPPLDWTVTAKVTLAAR